MRAPALNVGKAHQLVLTDARGRTTWVNGAFTANTGFTVADMQGRPPGSVLQGEGADPVARHKMAQAIAARLPVYGIELLNHRKDGSTFFVRLDIEPQFDAQGRHTGFLSVQTDVSGQQGDRDRLALLQHWLEVVQRDEGLGFFQRNYATDEAVWDARMRSIWELPPEVPGLSLAEFRATVVEEDRERTDGLRAASIYSGAIDHAVFRIRTARGALRWVRTDWIVQCNERGEPVAVGTSRDVTAEVEARHAAEAERAQFLMAAELTGVGLVRREFNVDNTQLNDAARRLYGLPLQGPVRGDQITDAIHPEDRPAVLAAWERLKQGDDGAPELRYRIRHPDGRVVHAMAKRRLVRDAQGQPVAAIGAFYDMSQQVAAAEALAHQRQLQAERDNATALASARHALLAAVGHEVRAPLNVLMVAAEQLAGVLPPESTRATRWLVALQEAASHLHGLAEDLLVGMQQEHEAVGEAAEDVSLNFKVTRAFEWLQGTAASAGVQLQADDSLQGLQVHAPVRRLRQVVLNLVGNAIKYNRRGGIVRCSGEVPTPGWVCLVVEDNGLGMSEAQRQQLFRPFDRLGRDEGAVRGFGLGLYLAERFVREMGGQISVSSAPGAGSVFRVTLPVAQRGAPRGKRRIARPVVDRADTLQPSVEAPVPHLLCVDDDPMTATLLQAQLAGLNVLIDSVCDGAQALACAREVPPQLVVLDVNLKGEDGSAVLSWLRDAGYQGPAVAYTGDADPLTAARLRQCGFAEIWIKPMPTPLLVEAVQRVLPAALPERSTR